MLPSKRNAATGTERLGVLLLSAGYGTRLQQDIAAAPSLSMLLGTPKPLLPLGGQPILSHWLSQLSSIPALASIVLVTNATHVPLYEKWSAEVHSSLGVEVSVISDGSVDNASRLGAVKGISIGLAALKTSNADKALIIAGDTMLPGVDMSDYVTRFVTGGHAAATFAYPLPDMADCVRRGMFKLRKESTDVLMAEALVEKPKSPQLAPSNLGSAPVYLLQREMWHTVDQFLAEREKEGVPLEKRDAPGFWLGWLIPQVRCRLFRVERRIDIGGLQHYMDALWELSLPRYGMRERQVPRRAENEPAVGRAHPRAGLLGNPSDGYGGKVIAVSIASEGFAEVVATPHDKFLVRFNPEHELREEFDGLGQFLEHVEDLGLHYSARTLILAAAVVFARVYKEYLSRQSAADGGIETSGKESLDSLPNCQLTYATSIPARIGLSGSSAFILATLRALARFHSTSLAEINELHMWPNLMRSAETELLGISCGLQDRVVQVMQGCVAMDFTECGTGQEWEWLPEHCLPELWLTYSEGGRVGECSGKVHGDLKSRFLAKDPIVLDIVKQLCDVADSGREILEQCAKGNSEGLKEFPRLVKKNFELRVALVGPEGVGKRNMELISVAKRAGFAAKMTGSGGCALCVPDPVRQLTTSEIEIATAVFKDHGMLLHKAEILGRRDWLP